MAAVCSLGRRGRNTPNLIPTQTVGLALRGREVSTLGQPAPRLNFKGDEMTTKTIHRIRADKVVIEDDRRKEAEAVFPAMREIPFSYDKRKYKYKIIYVPVEPQPEYSNGLLRWKEAHGEEVVTALMLADSPFHPDDTLVLMEEWVYTICKDGDSIFMDNPELLSKVSSTCKRFAQYFDQDQPTSMMPPELDSKCQQLTVVKVLGVEELKEQHLAGTIEEYFITKGWHWKLLATEI